VKRGPLIAALASVGVIVLMVAVLILPKASQVRAKQREVGQAEKQESVLRLQVQQLQAAAREAPKNRRQLAKLQAAIPPTADLPGLLRLLNSAADQSGVDFMSVSPGQPAGSADGKTSVIQTQITVVGGFFAVDQYLFRLETLPRAARVNTVQVSPQAWPKLQVSLTVEFYTTDASAGPGSSPGATQPVDVSGIPASVPSQSATASPSPSASPSP
jgi:Tfp pilus assembly protein PilO